ncbi:MAG: chorismate-binding protein [Chlamydiia bacterium]|nr:chorismate-binding protein [Chlamydiia bacterium]
MSKREEFIRNGALISLNPQHVLIAYGRNEKKGPVWYVPDYFFRDPHPFHQFSSWAILERVELAASLEEIAEEVGELKWQASPKEQFFSTVANAKRAFTSGELKKVVPYISERAEHSLTLGQRAHVLSRLLKQSNERQHLYGIWNEAAGVMGATPEILFALSDQIETMAVAGTGKTEAIFDDPKERHEHQLVIDGIRSALHPFGEVVVGETALMRLPQLYHLYTPMRVSYRERPSFEAVARALHPTPALGGLPQDPALTWLEHFDRTLPRGTFGAPFGCQHGPFSRALVAIRNLRFTPNHLHIYAGCGIVPRSSAENEWQECRNKASSVRALCGL